MSAREFLERMARSEFPPPKTDPYGVNDTTPKELRDLLEQHPVAIPRIRRG